MSTVIKAENISKKYLIGHNKGRESSALREVLSNKVRQLTQKIKSPFLSAPEPAYEEFWALRDVSFEVKQGDRVGIIGRNGAGKSTLLKILSRITEPTAGRITIKRRVASLLEVGTGFHPDLTGRENIYLNGAILGMGRAEIRLKFDEIVDFAEVEKFIDTPVKHYSSGMYVRLAFAVAAHLEPEILIVDEVLAVGDAQFQKKCLGKMGDVGREGRTVLFVSHNLTAVRSLCNRGILLKEGIMMADGVSGEVVSKYTEDVRNNILVQEWTDEKTAPQNESAVLRKVAICDDDVNLLNEIYTDTPFNIEIEFKIKKEGSFVGLTVIIYDAEDKCVFCSINNHEETWFGKPMPIGTYKSRCTIPSNFFNNGRFSVTLNLFGKGYTESQMVHEVLTIEVLDGHTLRGDYYGEWGGVVRPALNWITRKTM